MKKLYAFLALTLAFVVFAGNRSSAISFTGHTEDDTCGGGVNYNFTISAAAGGLT